MTIGPALTLPRRKAANLESAKRIGSICRCSSDVLLWCCTLVTRVFAVRTRLFGMVMGEAQHSMP